MAGKKDTIAHIQEKKTSLEGQMLDLLHKDFPLSIVEELKQIRRALSHQRILIWRLNV